MNLDKLREEVRATIKTRKTSQRRASSEIGIGYATLLNFLGGAEVEEQTLAKIRVWLG